VIPIRDDNPTSRPAVVTIALILLNVAVYFGIQLPKSEQADVRFTYEWAGVPCEVRTGEPIVAVPARVLVPRDTCAVRVTNIVAPERLFPAKNVWLAVFYSMFLHGSILHVLGNMLFLWIFGNNVEDQLGHAWFLVVYLVGGIVASAAHIAGNLDSTVPFVGASGAVAVVMGAYIVWFPHARILTFLPPFIFLAFSLPAVFVLGMWFVLQFFTRSESGIATLAHIGGFVFGAVVAYALKAGGGFPRPRAAGGGGRYGRPLPPTYRRSDRDDWD
jgi:membrane associated rhomboid family serine protease